MKFEPFDLFAWIVTFALVLVGAAMCSAQEVKPTGMVKDRPTEKQEIRSKSQHSVIWWFINNTRLRLAGLRNRHEGLEARVASNEKKALVAYAKAIKQIEDLQAKVEELESRKPTVTYVQQQRRCRIFRRRR